MPQRPPRQRLSSNALIAINSRAVGRSEVGILTSTEAVQIEPALTGKSHDRTPSPR
jgi:hypothetical protein